MTPTLSQWLKRKPTGPKARKPMKRGGRIRPMSTRRQRQAKAYSLLRSAFLKAHPYCQAWFKIMLVHGLTSGLPETQPPSTDIHHMSGRRGGNYLNTDTWLAVSRSAHNWIHEHPREARALGLLT